MEYVSILAGQRFSDRPRCTDPLLGWLARGVNDAVSAAARPRLGLLAPELINTRGDRGFVHAVVFYEMARTGGTVAPADRWLRGFREIAEYHLDRRLSGLEVCPMTPGRRWQQPLWTIDRHYAFGAVLGVLDDLGPGDRDPALIELLSASIRRTRHHLGMRRRRTDPTFDDAWARDRPW